ncbi:MAG: hypothetical protein FJ034_04740 [Chloroflexi bacterium]|nr:hypothetical protein [Chloroflexota bacterium]
MGAAGTLLYVAGVLSGDVVRRPTPGLAVAVAAGVAISIALLCWAVRGRGAGDAAVGERPRRANAMRAAWLLVSGASLLGLVWLLDPPRPRLGETTRFHNDAIALDECAARTFLRGGNPYTDVALRPCFEELDIAWSRTTPLRAGSFAGLTEYPSDAALEEAWLAGGTEEFVGRLSYPALAFLAVAPLAAVGGDPNAVALAFLLASFAAVAVRAPSGISGFALTALLGAPCLIAFGTSGSADPLFALPLVVAWLWRERGWSAVALGLACATKQLAWLFVPYYLIVTLAERGPRVAARRATVAAAVFLATNLPFALRDPGAWVAGIATPLVAPMFPLGSGAVLLLTTDGLLPLDPRLLNVPLVLAEVGALAWAWRHRRSDPEMGAVLALAPLFFAPRSLFSYFFLMPLFAAAAIARMPLGGATVESLRRAGGVTLLAMPGGWPFRPR